MSILDKTNRKRYSDLDLAFIPHPVTKDISKKYDAEAVKRSIKCLVLTRFYERLMQPDIGCTASAMLFELANPLMANNIKTEIENIVRNHEPRAEIISVDVSVKSVHEYVVNIIFNIINRQDPITLNFILERTR